MKLTNNQKKVFDAIKDINSFDEWATLPSEGENQCTEENGIRQMEAFSAMIGLTESQKGRAVRDLIKKGFLKIVGVDYFNWRHLTVKL